MQPMEPSDCRNEVQKLKQELLLELHMGCSLIYDQGQGLAFRVQGLNSLKKLIWGLYTGVF